MTHSLAKTTMPAKNRTPAARKLLAFATAAAVVLCSAGCTSQKKDGWEDPFFPSKRSTPVSKTTWQRSAAIAAAQDATLFPIHFDGNELNGLGQKKVDLMVQGRPKHTPLAVYLNQVQNDPTNTGRVEAIKRSFGAAGLAEADFTVAVGPNPGTLAPASAGVRALAKAEAAGGTDTAAEEADSNE